MWIKSVYQKLIPVSIREGKLINACRKKYNLWFRYDHTYDKYDWQEVRVSLGKNNPDKTFLVIRNAPYHIGLLACYLKALNYIKKYEDDDVIPFMDMESNYNDCVDNLEDWNKRVNSWEHYFLPLSDYSFSQIKKSKNVIFSSGFEKTSDDNVLFRGTTITNDALKTYYQIDNKYFKLQPNIKRRFELKYEKLLKNKRVLGTMIRDDYIFLAAGRDQNDPYYLNMFSKEYGINNHPKQPSPQELCNILEIKMKEWNCDYLYVITETSYSFSVFKERFGERLIHSGREIKQIDELNYSKYIDSAREFNKTHPRVNENIAYLEEIYLLSKCTSISAGRCSGSVVAALWNRGEYEHTEILQIGVY